MPTPFFSICIPAYNPGNYFHECLKSIAGQSFQDYEVVVVDDGSAIPVQNSVFEDVGLDLAKCKIIRTANCGPYAARKTAFLHSIGSVLVSIDVDDALLDFHALSKLKEEYLDTNADLILYNASRSKVNPINMIDYSEINFGADLHANSELFKKAFAGDYMFNSLCVKAYKRASLPKFAKDRPRILMGEDRMMDIDLLPYVHSVALINEPLYFYRPAENSITQNHYSIFYYEQLSYVEGELLSARSDFGFSMEDWAKNFLRVTSNALLAIRYNTDLNFRDRIHSYSEMRHAHAFLVAREYLDLSKISLFQKLQLLLFSNEAYLGVDLLMLPKKVFSWLKVMLRK